MVGVTPFYKLASLAGVLFTNKIKPSQAKRVIDFFLLTSLVSASIAILLVSIEGRPGGPMAHHQSKHQIDHLHRSDGALPPTSR
jgi:hypothetical protein